MLYTANPLHEEDARFSTKSAEIIERATFPTHEFEPILYRPTKGLISVTLPYYRIAKNFAGLKFWRIPPQMPKF